MTYAEFKTFLTDFLWKENDAALIASLDNLIKMGEAALNRAFLADRRTINLSVTATTDEVDLAALGITVWKLVSMSEETGYKPVQLVSVSAEQVQRYRQTSAGGVYHYSNGKLLVAGGYTAEAPGSFIVNYKEGVPVFKTADASWLADQYLDLYVYAVLKHCAPYLREDERLAVWDAAYTDALNSAKDNTAWDTAVGGSPYAAEAPHPMP
jgi:hypothetical protein